MGGPPVRGFSGDGGPAASARLYNPSDAVLDPAGNLVIADQQNHRIRRVNPAGLISTIVGDGRRGPYQIGAPASSSPLEWPGAVAVDANGLLYFTEIPSSRVGRVERDGRLATIAGAGTPGYNGDDRPATAAQLFGPTGLALDPAAISTSQTR